MSNFLKKICIITATLLAVISACIFFFFYAYNTFYPAEFRPLINKKAAEYKIDKYLLTAVIYIESRFNQDATSPRGACGLMQLMPSTAEEISQRKKIKNYSKDMLYNAETNVDFGCYYLRKMLDKSDNNPQLALMSYNAGNTNVKKWIKQEKTSGKNILQLAFTETRNYVNDIFTIYRFLKYFEKFNI